MLPINISFSINFIEIFNLQVKHLIVGLVHIASTPFAMKLFNEHDTVIYTDARGRRFDTFVVYDTDEITGFTHINHEDLVVPQDALELHPMTIEKHHLPMS